MFRCRKIKFQRSKNNTSNRRISESERLSNALPNKFDPPPGPAYPALGKKF